MNKIKDLEKYIDVCIIDEYADKDLIKGYSLDIDSISEHARSNFLHELIKHDTSIRDLILNYMQKLIDERLPECESNDLYKEGLVVRKLSNGDCILVRDRGASW